jgi:lipopolysaccharide export LptBFGC system permease protein LptF
MKIWKRHVFFKLFNTVTFFLFCFFLVYVLMDLSVHGVRFFTKSSLFDILYFYIYTFAGLLDLFLSLSFLLASLKVLFDFNIHREFIALQMAGLSKKKLLSPFFVLAGLLSLLNIANQEWVAPTAQRNIDQFKEAHKEKKRKEERLFCISLKDHSELVFQKFDREKKELFDVFWIRTPSDIWHIKHLELEPVCGHFVTHFIRNNKDQMEKELTFERKKMPELLWDEKAIFNRWCPLDQRPLSTLLAQAPISSSEQPGIQSHLLYKILISFIPFLILIAVSPSAMFFSRKNRALLVVVCSLFALIALKVVMDGMFVLAENQVLPVFIAIASPILLTLGASLPSFLKLR